MLGYAQTKNGIAKKGLKMTLPEIKYVRLDPKTQETRFVWIHLVGGDCTFGMGRTPRLAYREAHRRYRSLKYGVLAPAMLRKNTTRQQKTITAILNGWTF